MTKKWIPLLLVTALLLVGCASQQLAAKPVERTIYMAAVEPKGGVTVDKEPFPAAELPAGGGYILKAPDDNGRWEVSTYRWDPGQVIVNQGDIVTLEIIGINGSAHPFTIEGHDVSGVVTRGHVTRVTFTADKAGVFKILCDAHMPAMQGELVVLASR
jgi:plastocyanin